MTQVITKMVTNEDGLERELRIYPLQIMDFFEVFIFNSNDNTIIKQTKKGDLETINIIDVINENSLEGYNYEIVFNALKEFISSFAKENNMRFAENDNILYIIDSTYLENVVSIKQNGEISIVTTVQGIKIEYKNVDGLITYIKDFLENKDIDKRSKIANFTSKEISVLKRELEIVSGDRERDKLSYNLKRLEFEKNLTEKFEEKLKNASKIITDKDTEIVKANNTISNLNVTVASLKSVISENEEEIKDLIDENNKFKKRSVLRFVILGAILGIFAGVFISANALSGNLNTFNISNIVGHIETSTVQNDNQTIKPAMITGGSGSELIVSEANSSETVGSSDANTSK